MAKFYITTTLPYVNSDPHIGFALEIIQADAIARYHRMIGDDVVFNTGTDEHGLKIHRKAQELGMETIDFCTMNAARFEGLKDLLNLTFTHFIRTTNEDHKAAAKEFWKRCMDKGDIYKKNYKIKYCVGCELEKTESELEDDKCPIHPNMEIEFIDEENYFFKFSKYQNELLKMYKDNLDFIKPAHRLTEMIKFTERGLEDFSISRIKEKMPWGVPVPGDQTQVMYVWFDALVDYISTLGWPNEGGEFGEYWPAVQVAGKDNTRQQSNMWQGMLMSAGIQPSKQILIHGFMTSEGKKMSKSLGNVVDPYETIEKLSAGGGEYARDALRYYLLREIPTYEDGDFSWDRFEAVYRGELCNNFGNLLNRIVSMMEKYFDSTVPSEPDDTFALKVAEGWEEYDSLFDDFNLKAACEIAVSLADMGNQYIEEEKPWGLAKTDEDKLKIVMSNLAELIRQIAGMLMPFVPEASARIFEQLGLDYDDPSTSSGLKGASFDRHWGALPVGHQLIKKDPLFTKWEEIQTQ